MDSIELLLIPEGFLEVLHNWLHSTMLLFIKAMLKSGAVDQLGRYSDVSAFRLEIVSLVQLHCISDLYTAPVVLIPLSLSLSLSVLLSLSLSPVSLSFCLWNRFIFVSCNNRQHLPCPGSAQLRPSFFYLMTVKGVILSHGHDIWRFRQKHNLWGVLLWPYTNALLFPIQSQKSIRKESPTAHWVAVFWWCLCCDTLANVFACLSAATQFKVLQPVNTSVSGKT